ncbi:MAG: LysE family translocator [Halofilum sp. (in: g-proteobacteria)]
MQLSLTLSSMAGLFGAMAVLAAVPSVSVLLVSARAASAGFAHGALVSAGILAADVLFVVVAIFGLVLLVESLGDFFALVRYLGGAYLIALGYMLVRGRSGAMARPDSGPAPTRVSSFAAGLLVTLADQKALLFYFGFFPAFVDLTALTVFDVAAILAITVLAVGGVKLVYAYVADRAGRVVSPRVGEVLHFVAAGVMIIVGVWVIART